MSTYANDQNGLFQRPFNLIKGVELEDASDTSRIIYQLSHLVQAASFSEVKKNSFFKQYILHQHFIATAAVVWCVIHKLPMSYEKSFLFFCTFNSKSKDRRFLYMQMVLCQETTILSLSQENYCFLKYWIIIYKTDRAFIKLKRVKDHAFGHLLLTILCYSIEGVTEMFVIQLFLKRKSID